MRSITLSQLRNTRQLKLWLLNGETIELRDRKTVIGRFIPNRFGPLFLRPPAEWPDFNARIRETFGDRILPANALRDSRGE